MVPGSNPGGSEIFRTCPDRPWGPPSLLYNGYRVFPEGKERPGREADPSPPSSAELRKSRAIPLLPLGHNRVCNGVTVPLMFLNCSTCFERHTAHHQELKNCNCSLWFYICLWLPAAVMADSNDILSLASKSPHRSAMLPSL